MTDKKQELLTSFFILISALLLVAIYYSPVWWVALTAPNYPEESFPDGVRINFHMNGVFNGCKKINKAELAESEALDCVHEMDTINHYVGMYPIAAGGVIERAFSPFLVALLIVMLLGYLCTRPRLRLIVLAVGFSCISVWMSMTWYAKDGLNYHNPGYLYALVTSMDQDTNIEADVDIQQTGTASLSKLRASLAGQEYKAPEKIISQKKEQTEKEKNII